MIEDATFKGIELSIVIVNWNGARILEKCLATLTREIKQTNLEIEIIMVDNHSTDDSLHMVSSLFSEVIILRKDQNYGFAAGSNQGIKKARGSYVLLLNNDTEVLPGLIPALLNYLKKNSEVGVAGGLILNPDGTPQLSYGYFPTLSSLLARYLIRHQTPYDQELMRQFNPFQPDITHEVNRLGCIPEQTCDPEEVDYVSGACLMARRELFATVGYFDEGFFAYFEDTDWCFRVKKQGWKVQYCPHGTIIHHLSFSFEATGRKEITFLRSMMIYVHKHFSQEDYEVARKFLMQVFQSKINYFSQLAREPNMRNYQAIADDYQRLLKEGINLSR